MQHCFAKLFSRCLDRYLILVMFYGNERCKLENCRCKKMLSSLKLSTGKIASLHVILPCPILQFDAFSSDKNVVKCQIKMIMLTITMYLSTLTYVSNNIIPCVSNPKVAISSNTNHCRLYYKGRDVGS